jgi:hypothetical protein
MTDVDKVVDNMQNILDISDYDLLDDSEYESNNNSDNITNNQPDQKLTQPDSALYYTPIEPKLKIIITPPCEQDNIIKLPDTPHKIENKTEDITSDFSQVTDKLKEKSFFLNDSGDQIESETDTTLEMKIDIENNVDENDEDDEDSDDENTEFIKSRSSLFQCFQDPLAELFGGLCCVVSIIGIVCLSVL